MTFIVCLAAILLAGTDGSAIDRSLRGYVQEMPLLWDSSPLLGGKREWRLDLQTQARQNLRCYPHPQITVAMECDERLLLGESIWLIRQTSDAYRFDEPYFDWRKSLLDEEDAVLEAEIDRLWITAYQGDLEVTIGRQRIAWGTALVWNPIDLFNPSSPLDFANIEKPGADGLRAQYYLGAASRIEIAGALRRPEEHSIAVTQLVLNRWEYDWHFLGGRQAEEWVTGLAWAGNIHGGGFRGELLGRFPAEETEEQEDSGKLDGPPVSGASGEGGSREDAALTAVLSGDYTFRSSLYLHGEVLFDSRGTTGDAGGLRLVEALQEGRLTPARWSVFAEVARQLHPLVYAGLSGILNPSDRSWYAGPTVTWNALTNLDITLTGQLFGGDSGTEFGDNGTILLAQGKWSW
jgi:hypothetical protein